MNCHKDVREGSSTVIMCPVVQLKCLYTSAEWETSKSWKPQRSYKMMTWLLSWKYGGMNNTTGMLQSRATSFLGVTCSAGCPHGWGKTCWSNRGKEEKVLALEAGICGLRKVQGWCLDVQRWDQERLCTHESKFGKRCKE